MRQGARDRATILALNAGSSSLKAAVRAPGLVLTVVVDRLGTPGGRLAVAAGDGGQRADRPFAGGLADAVEAVGAELRVRGLQVDAVAHRVVHGGVRHHEPAAIDAELLADLREAIPLAPLHLPGGLEGIGRAQQIWPDARHVACFDTGFHHGLPESSRRLPVAAELDRCGVRRYGFHGLSISSVLHAHPDLGGAVIAHLGSGCSVTAVAAGGRPLHTTMSLTPTGGMMSATRSGDLDPEVVLYLIEQHGYTVGRLRDLIDRQSGLAGIATDRHDVRDLLAAADAPAALALEAFVGAAAAAIAGCATYLASWDALVFTGGVGEHAGALRGRICARLIALRGGGGSGEAAGDPEGRLGSSGLRVLVVRADEEAVMDRLTRRLLPGR